jgi:hypothetical protein
MADTSSEKTLIELITSYAAANVYDIIDATLDYSIDGNPITEIPALGVYRTITETELVNNVEEVTQRIQQFNADLVELLSELHTDAQLASNRYRGDGGFETKELIENFAAKYGFDLEGTIGFDVVKGDFNETTIVY